MVALSPSAEQILRIKASKELVVAIGENNSRDMRFRINYWVPHLEDNFEDSSFFQAFLPGILSNAEFIILLAGWPADVRELVSQRHYVLFSRIAGYVDLSLSPIQVSAFEEITLHCQLPFNCVVSTEDTVDQVSVALQSTRMRWLHLSTKPDETAEDISNFSADRLLAYVREVAEALPEGDPFKHAACSETRQRLRAAVSAIQCPTFCHNVTLPNETGLRALRYAPTTVSSLEPARYLQYVDAILRTATVVSAERRRLLRAVDPKIRPTTTLALAVESMIWPIFRGEAGFNQARVPRESVSAAKAVLRKVVRQEKYIVEMLASESSRHPDLMESLQAERRSEMKAFTAALSVLGGPTMTPVVRLEPKLNLIRNGLIDLEGCARGCSPHREFKLNKLGRRVREELRSKVDPRFMTYLAGFDRSIEGMTLVADIPLEWLPLGNVPLCLRHDVSRIPATPGNVMMMQCLKQRRLDIGKAAFDEILVIRSFKDGDRLRKLFESVVNQPIWNPAIGHRFRFVDVQTPKEFVAAVNSFTGAMMIFDGHGTRNSDSAVGSIIVGGRPLDVWSLRKEVSMPPIVLLSACDTLPLDGSHGSTAVGMLMLGAVTVLATIAPIDGLKAALLLARLAYRLEVFVPLALKFSPRGLSWRSIMSGLLRMNYTTDVLFALRMQHKLLSESDVEHIGSLVNVKINTYQADWHDLFVEYVCEAAGGSREKTLSAFDTVSGLPDSIKYVQVGRPELINIVDETISEILDRHRDILVGFDQFRPLGDLQ